MVLILFPRMDHPVIMLLERAGIVAITFALIYLSAFSVLTIPRQRAENSASKDTTFKIMKQRNWQCDISPLVEELGYRPEYPLDKGVKEIIAWNKKEGWL